MLTHLRAVIPAVQRLAEMFTVDGRSNVESATPGLFPSLKLVNFVIGKCVYPGQEFDLTLAQAHAQPANANIFPTETPSVQI